MSKKIQLEINERCHENWNNMTPADKGRFCDSCQKQVVDFTTMSDREIAQFFKKPSTGSICGRFMNDQLNREIEIPKKRIPWVKYFFQFALPTFLFSLRSTAQGLVNLKNIGTDPAITCEPPARLQMMGDTTVSTIEAAPKKSVPNDKAAAIKQFKFDLKDLYIKQFEVTETIELRKIESVTFGFTVATPVQPQNNLFIRIINEDDEPVPFASILFTATGGSKVVGKEATADGSVTINTEKKWKKAEVIVTSAGYHDKKIEISRRELPQEELVVRLQRKDVLPEVVIRSGWMGLVKRVDVMGSVTTGIPINSPAKAPEKRPIVTEPVAPVLRVYPNPVLAGSTINIACEKLDEGYYAFQLLNISGQVIYQREVWVDDKATVLNFELPRTAAGSYVLRMIHKQTGKSFTEKVIIQ